MLRRTALLLAIYCLGTAAIGGWSLSHLLGGTVTRENFALVVVLPIAWLTSFWPMATSLVMILRIRALRGLLAQLAARVEAGAAPTHEQRRELEDVFTQLAAQDNGLPELLMRPLVRRALDVLLARAQESARGAASR